MAGKFMKAGLRSLKAKATKSPKTTTSKSARRAPVRKATTRRRKSY